MKLLWITNLPSPYRVAFFNELGKICDLTVLFERSRSTDRDKSWGTLNVESFKAVFLPGWNTGASTAFCPSVLTYLTREYDRIVITDFSTLTGILAINYLKLRRIPYCIESDGGFPGNGRGLKEKIKSWILPGAELYFSTADVHDRYYRQYGVKPEKIVRYPFTSISAQDVIDQPVPIEQKLALRAEIGMPERYIVVSVGRFIHLKGFDVLLEACKSMDQSIGFYIIGGKPTEAYLEYTRENQLTNVHFVDFKRKNELERYYMAADLFVLPTRIDVWGLVVNEAMAKGLPVVTTDHCVAGLEMVRNGVNGYLVPVDDSKALANAISITIDNRVEMSLASIRTAKEYTVEKMITAHYHALVEK